MFTKIYSISSTCSIHIRKTTTSSLYNNKMKTIILSKFINCMCPKLSIDKTRKSKLLFTSSYTTRRINTRFISTLHTSIIKKIIIITAYMNIFNRTIRILPYRSTKTILSTVCFTLTKLSIRNTIFFKISIFISIGFKIISHFCK